MSDRLLNSFEQQSKNNTQAISQLITELKQTIDRVHNIPVEIKQLIKTIEKHEKQINSDINNLHQDITNKANQQIQNLTDKFKF